MLPVPAPFVAEIVIEYVPAAVEAAIVNTPVEVLTDIPFGKAPPP